MHEVFLGVKKPIDLLTIEVIPCFIGLAIHNLHPSGIACFGASLQGARGTKPQNDGSWKEKVVPIRL